ncbi:molybdopterin-dependent oxidoreductase [Mycobacterium sp. SMC-2]|uniref:molybdopterin-dependent oxidoreductase n=1 Tax=Mycobacterium sp. SMC-2 TaxID=2857058 RepID=UPI0021B3F431|nr:molybdopterin-dependent oxidoreductase [Mycobacterium sp. SMC-2]UXA08073.1 molybdopterin-dependent oxidoreductase [Mycobacterium sp. SMC-2]
MSGSGKDSVQHINWPGTGDASSGSTQLKEVELVEVALESYSAEIHPAHDQIDVQTYGGGFDLTRRATAPKLRVGRDKWFNLLWLIPIGFALLVAGVAIGKGLHNMPAVQAFIQRYPGTDSRGVPPGMHAWEGWTHFFNLFLMTFIIRSGIQILCDHPRLYFSRNCTPGKDEWLRVGPPVPEGYWTANDDTVALPGQFGLPGFRHSIGLARWWHLGTDVLWLLNGLVFYVLLFTTGQWRHLVPMSWDVFPNAASVAIQYLSLDWPANDNGWVAYNGMQLLAYFTVVFIAAPAALITGLGMSPALSMRLTVISKRLSIQAARSLHFLVLVFFLFFILVHVTLVFATEALRNLNHMFASRDDTGWIGFGVFCVAMVVTAVGWVAATPVTIRHPRVVQRVGDALIGPLQRLLERMNPEPGAFTEKDISPYFWHNGRLPDSDEYKALEQGGFRDWRLRISGLVDHPREFSLDELKALPYHEQITQHFCIQAWSGVAKWGGVSMRTIMDIVKPRPEAKWVAFYSMGLGATGGIYYNVHPIEQMSHHLTMLAYTMNDEPLSYGHGAPLRLRNELQHGFKQVKWIKGIEFLAHYSEIGSGYGGYSEDHKYFGRHQTI